MDACSALEMREPAAATAPARVRRWVQGRLAEWELADIGDDLALIASELVTNAIRCTVGREIKVRLTREPGAVRLAVWDASDGRPVRRRSAGGDDDPEAGTGGWGLPIVEALSEKCGVTPTRPRGKWVWARYAISGGAAVAAARPLVEVEPAV
ncbi:anti-sigma regulatory factor (Ser/Thr protein kinase) [Actinomadura pelletieri DSM 43383]|uniref:Anti-sigma regulatory factor (Ser/Thr protein kinase) n=1 Tax=Actinomadura pelletieri DSM 43383 TaxID=1120940 RepID=A0A495QRW6_9ACTN|nr:ATP-binding protein [Actinomadura pelletieri]RKS76235.1 anti-sigma regulatory factor (Ser/Thr protein kinase) [Actinomadura pelletieri DSM 43383]